MYCVSTTSPSLLPAGWCLHCFLGCCICYLFFEISFATHYRDILLIVFFTAIGLSTEVRSIIKGGKVLLIITVFAIAFIILQNYTSLIIAKLFNLNQGLGIIAGSAALQGGHGNIVSWAPIINDQFNTSDIMEIGMIMATFGLIIGGIFGGPVAKYLIKKYNLKQEEVDKSDLTIGSKHVENLSIDYNSILRVIIMVFLAVGIGIYLHNLLNDINFTLPMFATCMLGGVIIANLVPVIIPKLKCPSKSPTLAITSDLRKLCLVNNSSNSDLQ